VSAVRSWRSQAGVKPGERLPARILADGYGGTADLVARLARLDLGELDGAEPARIVVPGGVLEVVPGDPEEAARKRADERARLQSEIARAEGKLANQGFVAKAPEHLVVAERDKLERLRRELEAL